MTAKDPKPGRRIPDEGLFTLHFVTKDPKPVAFDVQVIDLSPSVLSQTMRREFNLSTHEASYELPKGPHPGMVYSRGAPVGRFTITPPTLKGDPDEPT